MLTCLLRPFRREFIGQVETGPTGFSNHSSVSRFRYGGPEINVRPERSKRSNNS